jgi:hypothetical protein
MDPIEAEPDRGRYESLKSKLTTVEPDSANVYEIR